MKLFPARYVVLALCFLITDGINAETRVSSPRNVVLFIGDGMDDHQITIARNYLVGATGRLILDRMPVRGSVQVLTIDESDPNRHIYVADSAGSGTSMSTGSVTSRGRIATSAGEDQDLETIAELAFKAGFRTGVVTTAAVTDATPATFAAHINYRFCLNPAVMQSDRFDCSKDKKINGGPGSISEQLAESNLDVLMGGGRANFDIDTEDGSMTITNLALTNGFQLLYTEQDLNRATPGKKWLGLFASENLAPKFIGQDGRSAEKPKTSLSDDEHGVPGDAILPAPMTCVENPDARSSPSLKLMTERALENLSFKNDKGFFLMVESALIDKQSHVRNACGSIGEVKQLDETLEYVLSFAESHPETLILVTADHGQAAQLFPAQSLYSGRGIAVYTPGSMVRIKMADGGIMGVNYATNEFFVEEHTGVAVPLYANEAGRALIQPFITQPQIYEIMRRFLGL